jgi:hypothetical protein
MFIQTMAFVSVFGYNCYMHVDLLRSDWSTRRQALIARVTLTQGGGVTVVSADAHLAEILNEPVWRADEQRTIAPDSGIDFLHALTAKYNGSLLVATDAHEEADCHVVHDADIQELV